MGWVWLGLYAIHYGLAEGGQRAIMAEFVPKNMRGRACGIQLACEGAALLVANVAFGYAYERLGAPIAFAGAGALAIMGAALLAAFVPAPSESVA